MNGPTGRDVSGTDRCRCSPLGGCGEWFNSTYAFDLHRVGKHGLNRRCMTTPEMLGHGMGRNADGYWISASRAVGSRETASAADQPVDDAGPRGGY
jgi:hypothetical protein